jgi:hypothetical protein
MSPVWIRSYNILFNIFLMVGMAYFLTNVLVRPESESLGISTTPVEFHTSTTIATRFFHHFGVFIEVLIPMDLQPGTWVRLWFLLII